VIFFPILALLLGLAAPPAARAETPPLTLELQPSAVTLDPASGRGAEFLVVARNPAKTEVTAATLSFPVHPAGVTEKVVRSPSFPSSTDLAWTVRVSGAETTPSPASLVVALTYATADTPAALAAATLSVTLAQPFSFSALKATLLPATGSVDQATPLDLILHIDNPTVRTAAVGALTVLTPRYLHVASVPPAVSVPPGGSADISFQVATTPAVIPGAYSLVIGFTAAPPGRSGPGEKLIAAAGVTVGVPGVSEAMQFLGIPSLLLLPGAITILMFAWLFPILSRMPAMDWKQPGLIVFGLALSFAYAFAYPRVTASVLGERHDYLKGYSLYDVVYLWSGAALIGAAAAVLAALARWMLPRAFQPTAADSPIGVLRKLALHGKDFHLDAATRRAGEGTPADPQHLLVLPFGKVAPDERWLVQRIGYRPTGRPGAVARADRINDALTDTTGTARATWRLCWAVQLGLWWGDITLNWQNEGNGGPSKVPRCGYEPAGVRDPILFRA
jgi:hypothetical protein